MVAEVALEPNLCNEFCGGIVMVAGIGIEPI